MKAIFKRELYSLLHSLRGWGYAAVVLLTAGVSVLLRNVLLGAAGFEGNAPLIAMSMIPATAIAAADVFQAERRQNTERLVYSLPIGNFSIVVGKMLALIVPVLIACVGLCVFPLILMPFSGGSMAAAYASILVLTFMGILMMAIGLFMSAFANNLFMAILGTIALPVLSWLCPLAAAHIASVSFVNIPFLIAAMLLVFAAVYLMSGSGTIAIFMAGAVEIPILLHYLRGMGKELSAFIAGIVENLNLFDALTPLTGGIFDGRVLVGQLLGAAFFTFVTVLLIFSRRQAKRRAL